MSIYTRIPALALLTIATPAFAEDATSLVQAVEAKYSKVQAMQADFVQVSKNEMFGETKETGQLTLKRPKQMFWNFTGGEKKQFVTDGKTMWVYSAESNQVIRYDDISQASSTADSLLSSLDSLDEVFQVTVVPDSAGHTLDLAPKKQGNVKKLHLELSPDLLVEKVVITDSFDSVTELQFSDVKLNVTVPDSMFQFQVPAGAEVISASGN